MLDRIEDRVVDAEPGLFMMGPGADAADLASSAIEPGARLLWERWDGLDLANGELLIHSLRRVKEETSALATQEGWREGDLVIGHRGRDTVLLSRDPWEDGADVLVLDEDGEVSPFASTVEHLVLGIMGEISVLYDEMGEFREALFDEETGELTEKSERRLLRRRLDLDPDAPAPRLRLAQLLRRAGELRGARKELNEVVKRAPSFAWAQFELGRVRFELGQRREAYSAFEAASEADGLDPGLEALFHAWRSATAPDELAQRRSAARVRELYPSFVKNAEAGAREALGQADHDRARQLVTVGLAVEPGHLGLLSLRPQIAEPAAAKAEAEAED